MYATVRNVRNYLVRTNEQIQRKESSENDENNEENIIPHGFFVSRLLINIGNIDGIIHDIHPTFECGHLEQCKQTNHWVIKCNLAIYPSISSICNRLQIKANFPEWLCYFGHVPRRPRFESWQWQKFIFKLNFLTARDSEWGISAKGGSGGIIVRNAICA